MTERRREPVTPDQLLPVEGLPVDPASAPSCMRCGRGSDAVLGEVTKDRHGWWQHRSCAHWTEVEASGWSWRSS
jgi:hypothetical protein